MIRPIILLVSALLTTAATCQHQPEQLGSQTRAASKALIASLTPEQKDTILLPAEHANRWSMRFTGGGYRPGLPLSSLSAAQRIDADALIALVLSPKGLAKAKQVAAQDGAGLDRMVLAFFGDPSTDGPFAWRLGEHHFTIVHVEIVGHRITEVGPILLGANPYGLWDDEQDAFLSLYRAAGSPDVIPGSAISSEPLLPAQGREVPEAAKPALAHCLDQRFSLFTDPVRTMLSQAFQNEKRLKLAFFNEAPAKTGAQGGRWDAKLGSKNLLLDLELSRGHTHMSLWVRASQ